MHRSRKEECDREPIAGAEACEGEDHEGNPHPVVRIDQNGLGRAAGLL
jgi:hypothetical protein